MYDDILLPTDGSPAGDGAVARALELARIDDATVHVLYVVDTGPEPRGLDAAERETLRRHGEKRGREATARIRAQATAIGLDVVRHVREGFVHRTILAYTGENAIDLIVTGAHGRTGTRHPRPDSTTERVVALANVPVLVVPSARGDGDEDEEAAISASGDEPYDHVVIPTDGSDVAERAAEHGLELAERYGADVRVLYVVDTRAYGFDDAPRSIVGLLERGGKNAVDVLTAAARDRGLPATGTVLRGVPEDVLSKYVAGLGGALLVMGTHGVGAGSDRLLGSTTAGIVRRAETSVLAIG